MLSIPQSKDGDQQTGLEKKSIFLWLPRDTPHPQRWKGQKRTFQANGTRRRAGTALLVSDQMNLKPELGRRDRKGNHIVPREKGHQRDITSLSIQATCIRTFNFINGTRYKVRDGSNISIGDEFNTLLSPTGRSSGQKQQNIGIK